MVPLIVLVGFAPTYYLKDIFGTPPLPSRLVYVHGLLMTAWVALFVVQTRLIAARKVRVHQRLGYAGVALAVLIVITGVPMLLRAGKYGSASFAPGVPSRLFMIVPIFDLLTFMTFFGAAVWYRRRPAEHKRLMLLAALAVLPPALGRMTLISLRLGPFWLFGVPSLLALIAVGLDARRYGRVHWLFAGGALLLIASFPVRLVLMMTPAWARLSSWLTSFV